MDDSPVSSVLSKLETDWPWEFKTGKFLTLHKRRKKKAPTRSLNYEKALLDDIYHGPIRILLERISEWPFNAFALDRATGGRPLPTLCFHLFHRYGLLVHFKLDPVKVWKFFSLVEEGYHGNNPYHNAIHAADVTQAMHCFLQEDKMRSNLTPLEMVSSLIAAMAHDLDHPGVNQPFLVATSNHLASLYKNASVLENHHWRSAIACLMESGMMDMLDSHSSQELQRQIQSLILATDITRQQEFLNAFKDYLDCDSLDLTNANHRLFMLQIALKCADISNPCRPWEVSRAWSLQVSEEFYRQGDLERRLGLPVALLCDRYASSVSKIQTGFYKFIAAPLFEEWHRFQETSLSWNMLNHLRLNQRKWDSLLEAEENGQPSGQDVAPNDLDWSELGILGMGIENNSWPATALLPGRSLLRMGDQTDLENQPIRTNEIAVTNDIAVRSNPVHATVPDPPDIAAYSSENKPFRSRSIYDSSTATFVLTQSGSQECDETDGQDEPMIEPGHCANLSNHINRLFSDVSCDDAPTIALPRRESLPFNFPDRIRLDWPVKRGRRESLPAKVPERSRALSADDVLPELSITSITPFLLPLKKDRKNQHPVSNTPLPVPLGSTSDVEFGCTDNKENLQSSDIYNQTTSTVSLRRSSAPIALLPVNRVDASRCKRSFNLARQSSLRLANYEKKEIPDLRRRGSLPYELGRKLSSKFHESIGAVKRLQLSDNSKLDPGSRRGSAPCDLLRNTSASIASYWIQFRDRIKFKNKESVISAGSGLGETSGFAVRERRRRSLRRRRSGGPELFASVIRRGNSFQAAHLPPLPQSVTCMHAKAKQRTLSLSPPEDSRSTLIGSSDANHDTLILGRRGSGALELLAGLWKQNKDRSARSSFDSDEQSQRLPLQRPSIDSSSSSDGMSCSLLDDHYFLAEYRRSQRRGSFPADPSSLSLGNCSVQLEMNGR